MKGFIEVNDNGKSVLISATRIESLVEKDNNCCCIYMNTHKKSWYIIPESYEEIKHKIEEALR